MKLETNLLEFLDFKEVFDVDGWLIICVYGGNLYNWNNLGRKGVRGGHCREFESLKVGFRF